ncbi:MAG: phosphoribosylamine--glycine ligase [Chloroflexota bacterium]|nr:phosphoribosylamine--glycine ligase [Chloroflexota bacterium]
MPTRILIVGGGGREHALAWKLAAEPGVNEVIVAPGSDGIATEGRVRCLPNVDSLDGPGVVAAAREAAVELAVIGPEAALVEGVADDLRAAGVATFGPSAAAARIESSKAFCRDVAASAGVRMAAGRAFDDANRAIAFARGLEADGRGMVVKADGLAAGKGVTVCDAVGESEAAIRRLFGVGAGGGAGSGGMRLVVEERLEGREASVIALTDGRDVVALPAARDHKRLLDGDRGPNTGGMGGYSPLPDLADETVDELLESIHRPILAELARRGAPFVGALYAGLMLTADGPVLLECNARFGDPETQIVLPRLAVPVGPLLLAAARRQLRADAPATLPVLPGAAVGIVLAGQRYPDARSDGDAISGIDAARESGALVFHMGTRRLAGGWQTSGGRVLTVVGRGADLASARVAAEAAVDCIHWDGMQRRRDIGATMAGVPA